MAKKSKDFTLDQYGFNADLDIPDFNFRPQKQKNDRTPITAYGKSFATGVKDTVKNPSFIRRLMKDSLPRGYGSAMDLGDQTLGTVKSLYNDTAREIKPAIKDIKRYTKRIIPQGEGMLPKSMVAKIKKWAEDDPDSQALSAQQQQESSIQSQLAQIFQFEQTNLLQRNAELDARENIKEGIAQGRHKDQIAQLDEMRISLKQMAAYQKVDSAYKHKSLEIQLRHYFATADMLNTQKLYFAESKMMMEGILKNTGLPEFAKLKKSERLAEVLRNKFIDAAAETIWSKRRQFVQKVGGALLGQVKDKITGAASAAQQAVGMAESLADMREMQKQFGMQQNAGQFAAEMGGGLAANFAGSKFAQWARGKAQKHQGIVRGGNRLQYFVNNLPGLAMDWARSDKGESGGIFDGVVRSIKDAVKSAHGVDTGLVSDKAANMQDPAHLSRGAIKSITEIIPGYLSHIHREIKALRTGSNDTPLMVYDFNSGKFTDRGSASKAIFQSIVRQGDRDRTKQDLDRLVNELDHKGKLTPEQKKILGRKLMHDNLRGESGSVKRLSDMSSYTGDASPHGAAFSQLFKEYFADDPTASKQLVFANEYGRLGSSISDNRKIIQDHVNTGNREALEQMGILTPGSDNINMNRLYDLHFNDEQFDGGASGPEGATKAFRVNRKRHGPLDLRHHVARAREQRPLAQTAPLGTPGPLHMHPEPTPTPASRASQPSGMHFEELIKAVQESSSRAASETMSGTLERIEHLIEQGIHVHAATLGATASGAAGGTSGIGLNHSIRSNLKGLFGLGSKTLKTGLHKAMGIGSTLNGLFTKGLGVAANAGIWAMNKVGILKDKIQDIYVKGDVGNNPRLLAWKIKAGQYRDKVTGKIIKSYKDIKGAVIDEDGNIVLSAEDAKKAFVNSSMGKTMISTLGAAFNTVRALGDMALGGLPGVVATVVRAGKKLASAAFGLLDQPTDIYVKGKNDPVLLARTMRAGGYFSRITGAKISRPSQIDGPVVDQDGNIVLTAEEYAKGLLNNHGTAIKSGVSKLFHSAKDLATSGLHHAMRIGAFVKDKAMGLLGGLPGRVGDFFSGWQAKDGIRVSGSKKQLDVLIEIRDILKARLPEKKHVFGSVDGSDVRAGSYEEMLKKGLVPGEPGYKGGKKDDSDVDPATGKKGGMMGTLASLVAGLKGKKKGGDGKDDDDEDKEDHGVRDMVEGEAIERVGEKALGKFGKFGKWAKGIGKKGLGKIGKLGKFGRLGRLLGMGGEVAAEAGGAEALAAGGSGLAATAAGGTALAAEGAVGATAVAGGAAAGGGILSALGGILAGAGAVIGGIISSPVLLGIAAVAAIGTAGYFLYKHFTKKKLEPLSTVRYAQYGFKPNDEDHLQQVMGLEDDLLPAVVWTKDVPDFDLKKIDQKKLLSRFDIDQSDGKAIGKFGDWFTKRFKPVFINSLVALRSVNDKVDLTKVDKDLKPAEKQKFLNIAKFPDGPYNEFSSPFPKDKSVFTTASDVRDAVAIADKAIAEEVKKAPGDASKPTDVTKPVVAATAAMVASAPAPVGPDGKPAPTAGTPATGTIRGVVNELTRPAIAVAGTQMSGTASGMPQAAGVGSLSALDCIRYKTYGLVDMDTSKIKQIAALEAEVAKNLTFGKGISGLISKAMGTTVAKWTSTVEELFKVVGPVFGIGWLNGNEGDDWLAWFKLRFLPVYLNYVSGVANATGKQDPKADTSLLKGADQMEIAKSMYTCRTTYGGRDCGVWQVPASPWKDYALNTDQKTVEGNIQAIKDQTTKEVAQDKTGKASTPGISGAKAGTAAAAAAVAASGGNPADASKATGFWGGMKEKTSKTWDSIKSADWSAAGIGRMIGSAHRSAVDATSAGIGSVVGAYDKAESGIKGAGKAIKGWYDSAVDATADAMMAIDGAPSKVAKEARAKYNAAIAMASDGMLALTTGPSLIDKAYSTAVDRTADAMMAASGLPAKAAKAARTEYEAAIKKGASIAGVMQDGVTSLWDKAKNAASSTLTSAVDSVKKAGSDFMKGFNEGEDGKSAPAPAAAPTPAPSAGPAVAAPSSPATVSKDMKPVPATATPDTPSSGSGGGSGGGGSSGGGGAGGSGGTGGKTGAASGSIHGIAEAAAAAKASEEKWGIPAAVTLAQWGIESGSGKHMPPGSNNPFGIKAVAGQPYSEAMTTEYIHGQYIKVPQKFAKYPSLVEAFDAHAKLLATSKYYKKARAVKNDPGAFADALTGVYATDPNYGAKLRNMMEKQSVALGNAKASPNPTTGIADAGAGKSKGPADATPSGTGVTTGAGAASMPTVSPEVAAKTPAATTPAPASAKPDTSTAGAGTAVAAAATSSSPTPSAAAAMPLPTGGYSTASTAAPSQPRNAFQASDSRPKTVQAADSAAQASYAKADASANIDAMHQTVSSSLGVQQDQLTTLKAILDVLQKGGGVAAQAGAPQGPGGSSQASGNQQSVANASVETVQDNLKRRNPSKPGDVPVSMNKRTA